MGLFSGIRKSVSAAGEKLIKSVTGNAAEKSAKKLGKKAFEEVGEEAAEKAIKKGAKKGLSKTVKVVGAAGAAGAGIFAYNSVTAADLKNSTPLTITSIENSPKTTNLRIKFENPKQIELYASDQITISNSNSKPSIDGVYENSTIISKTEIELSSTIKLITTGTAGTIRVHTTALKEAENKANGTVDGIKKGADSILNGASNIFDNLKKIAYYVISFIVVVMLGYGIKILMPLFSIFSSSHQNPYQVSSQVPLEPYNFQIPMGPYDNQVPLEPYVNQTPYDNQDPMAPYDNQVPLEPYDNQVPLEPYDNQVPLEPYDNQIPMGPVPVMY